MRRVEEELDNPIEFDFPWPEPLGVPLWVWLVGGTAVLYLLLKKPATEIVSGYIQAKY